VFVPERVQVPAPSLVRVPLPVVMVPLIVPPAAPPSVRFWLVAVMLLAAVLNVRVPNSNLLSK